MFNLGGCDNLETASKPYLPSPERIHIYSSELAGSDAKWLRNFLADTPLGIKPKPFMSIHCDCQTAIAIGRNRTFNGKNRHKSFKK